MGPECSAMIAVIAAPKTMKSEHWLSFVSVLNIHSAVASAQIASHLVSMVDILRVALPSIAGR
jgi:hypothetical protein